MGLHKIVVCLLTMSLTSVNAQEENGLFSNYLKYKQSKNLTSIPNVGGYVYYNNGLNLEKNGLTIGLKTGIIQKWISSPFSPNTPDLNPYIGGELSYRLNQNLTIFANGQYLFKTENESDATNYLYKSPFFPQSEINAGLRATFDEHLFEAGIKQIYNPQFSSSSSESRVYGKWSMSF
ncbi:hypothetical protein [Galbibacter mesophilus]|uniref:hypothetical protein n=1 Tax=Galbibacter mesophilus TaxID=379069 RepID=UPI00191E020F|nr:hypothetical protein [Galbibacter mesophilus]MCM5664125.1 hypothetical protein [Galbibacter mesophilus]